METQDLGRVVYEKEESGVARLVMNWPEKANLQDHDMVWAFDKALGLAEYDYDVKVLVIKSNAKGFCAGHVTTGEYPEFDENRRRTGTTWQGHTKLFLHPMLRLWEFPKPTIAQVHGYAAGGGSYWALLPDLTVCSEDAWFQMPHAYLTGLPGAETMIEPWVFMNYKRAAEYLYLRRKLTAQQALELGIVNEVVPRERLEETVEEWAAEIALCPVTTLTACKLLIKRAWELMGFRVHQQWSADMTTTVAAHSDFRAHLAEMMKKTGGPSEVKATGGESAWDRFPGYRIDLVPWRGIGRVRLGELVLAESDACLLVYESDHAVQLYFPESSVEWKHFEATGHHTTCPFKGEADYWTLTASGPPLENVVWTYRTPFDEVAGLAGYFAFYADRLEVELVEEFSAERGHEVVHRMPHWGDAEDLLRLMDVAPMAEGLFRSPPYPDPPVGTFFPQLRPKDVRLVVEGGQLLGEAIVAASRTVPTQRVTSASMIFSRAVRFDDDHEIQVEMLRQGRTFSTLQVHTTQAGKLCSAGLVLLDAGAPDTIRGSATPPDVPGPEACPQLDLGVTGRELRTVDDAYRRRPEETGPAEIHTWVRFRESPSHDFLHAALLAQSTTHWTIAAAMRPHEGITEALAHRTLSTGILATTVAFHDEFDVSEWLLYTNPAIYAGRGLVQGEGRVFSRDGRLVASYTVQAMVRAFETSPQSMGRDYTSAM